MNTVETLRPKAVLTARARELERLLRKQDMAIESVADPMDETQQSFERELAIDHADRVSTTLAEIRAALGRIEKGTYGVCEDCDDEIAPRRLAAVPWASRCLRCQEAFEGAPAACESEVPEMPEKRKGLQDAA